MQGQENSKRVYAGRLQASKAAKSVRSYFLQETKKLLKLPE
jgi:hypothetical protein